MSKVFVVTDPRPMLESLLFEPQEAVAVNVSGVSGAGFFNTSGPKRKIAVGSGALVGLGTWALGATAAVASLTGAGTVAAVWYALHHLPAGAKSYLFSKGIG